MHSINHVVGGVSLALGFSFVSLEPYFFIGAVIGSKAPDLLEFPVRVFKSIRVGIVPHRTITHWGLLWLLCCVWMLAFTEANVLNLVLLGFFSGGVAHLLQDACTPMGIPIILPFEKGFTFNLVHGWFSELYVNIALSLVFFATGYMMANLF